MQHKRLLSAISTECKTLLTKDTGLTKGSWLLWAALVFFIPMHLHYNHILNAFYTYGATFGDAGLFEAVVWRNKWWIETPEAYATGHISFLTMHFMPSLVILNFFSYLIDSHGPEFYAGYMAFVYGLFGLGMFGFFYLTMRAVNHIQLGGLAIISMLFAFNDIIMDGTWYVHVEYAVPAGMLLFLFFYLTEQTKAAIAVFIFTLLQREDAGFHFCTVLGVIAAIRYWETRSLNSVKSLINYICAAFVASAYFWYGTKYIRDYYGGRSVSNWELMYSGNPPFHHLTFKMIWDRLGFIIVDHPYMWIGLLLSVVFAYYKRSLYFIAALVACGPWFLLNIVAVQDMNGRFTAYYAFPFIIALAWPLVAAVLAYGTPLPRRQQRDVLILQVAMLISALVMWDSYSSSLKFGPAFGGRWSSYSLQPHTEHRAITQQFIGKFKDEHTPIGKVCADDPTLSLTGGLYNGKMVCRIIGKTTAKADTAFYFIPGDYHSPRGEIVDFAKANNLRNNYCISGSPICMVTNRTLDKMGSLQLMFSPQPSLIPDEPASDNAAAKGQDDESDNEE